jgi:hypothetical protein
MIAYFACLGAGFIMIEVVAINVFMRFIGFPTYAFAAALVGVLVAAGVGSAASSYLGDGRWRVLLPFAGAVAAGALFVVAQAPLFEFFGGLSLPGRIGVAVASVFPVGFFLGMPFPQGLEAVSRLGRRGGVGLFTQSGGVALGCPPTVQAEVTAHSPTGSPPQASKGVVSTVVQFNTAPSSSGSSSEHATKNANAIRPTRSFVIGEPSRARPR